MKPSERIKELAKEYCEAGIDPGFKCHIPDIGDWVNAVVKYLDECEEKK